MTSEPGTTIWEKLGAAAGLWAVLWLGIHYAILGGTSADPSASDAEFVQALLSERMKWEWVTFLRILGGLMIVWFMGSLASRLRLAEGEPGRLATIANGVGVLWGAVWLLSALFNSASITLAAEYGHPEGARFAGMISREMMFILTPSIVFTLLLSVSFVSLRFGGFRKPYAPVNATLTAAILILAILEWYGSGNLGTWIMTLALAWTGVTSALLVPAYRPVDLVRGSR
jgi:hypothetical protein